MGSLIGSAVVGDRPWLHRLIEPLIFGESRIAPPKESDDASLGS